MSATHEPAEEPRRSSKKKKSKSRELLSWVLCLVIAIGAALLIRFFVFEIVRVDGPSMEPTLHTGQSVFVEKVSRYFDGIHRGQIIIVQFPGKDQPYVKRVVALPGDTVCVEDGRLYVNGELQTETFTKEEQMHFSLPETLVPEETYFVLGDNRNNSEDSSELGPVPAEDILGHALFVIWPLDEISGLTQS